MGLLLGNPPLAEACTDCSKLPSRGVHSFIPHAFIHLSLWAPSGAPGLGETERDDHSELCRVRKGQGERRPEGEWDLVPPKTGALVLPPAPPLLVVHRFSAQGSVRELGFPLSPDTQRPTAGTRAPPFAPGICPSPVPSLPALLNESSRIPPMATRWQQQHVSPRPRRGAGGTPPPPPAAEFAKQTFPVLSGGGRGREGWRLEPRATGLWQKDLKPLGERGLAPQAGRLEVQAPPLWGAPVSHICI